MTIKALKDDRMLGRAQINLSEAETHLRWLEVADDARRQGVGSALLDEVEAQHGAWTGHGFTDDGASLMEARSSRDV